MILASEMLARVFENMNSCLPNLSDEELSHKFLEMDQELGLINLLRSLNAADREVSSKRNVILMFSDKDELQLFPFRDATDALRMLFDLEKRNPGNDIVLVRADTSEEMRIAFRNYFSDAREFINLVETACQRLSGHAGIHSTTKAIEMLTKAART